MNMDNTEYGSGITLENRTPYSRVLRNVMKDDRKKRTILIVEDSELNREILGELLQDEFQIIMAADGEEGIQALKKYREMLSLVLLDVFMPVCDGFQFLERSQKDPYLSSVPVIVTTGSNSHEDEEKCMQLGAMDFITKPYNFETIIGRIHNVIRLHESISALSIVEFDNITGLYTMSAFMHHAGEILSDDEQSYDLGIVRVQDFSSINRLYGENRGSEVLKYVAKSLKKVLPDAYLAKQNADFYILITSRNMPDADSLKHICQEMELNGPVPNLQLMTGLYLDIDKEQTFAVLCDRVKLSLESWDPLKDSDIHYYDESMENRLLEEHNMKTRFYSAIENHEFVIWIQPKVEIGTGKIVAGEALVRWIDETGNITSPGAFIPLFERDGQIQQLDEYVFQMICTYQNLQKKMGKRMVPISVNLSRNSLFQAGIVERYLKIAENEQIDLSMVPIEITESAATSAVQISDICNQFVKAGFHLQMDDFGTGFSSMSALAMLPFEVVKLDKTLIDQIGTQKGNIIIKNTIKTAHELNLKVVAEGVEEARQVEYLDQVKCDLIQGYYYSAPKNTVLFEEMLARKIPFADKITKSMSKTDSISKIHSSELDKYLEAYKLAFPIVRVMDANFCEYRLSASDEHADILPCSPICGESDCSVSCISSETMRSKKSLRKTVVLDDKSYIVNTIYIEIDDEPYVVELFCPL